MQASDSLSLFGASIKSLAKMLLQSRRATIRSVNPDTRIIIMANGPSLRASIDNDIDILRAFPTMAVNFAANAPEFSDLHPDYYLLADPHFFSGKDDPNLQKLFSLLASVDWDMTLLVPVPFRSKLPEALVSNPRIKVLTFNAVGIEGYSWLENFAYSHGFGMPRPRNVLVPALMAAMSLGYREIYILGADHSWIRNIDVTDDNRVVSIQPHFYKEDEHEQKRVISEYHQYPLHQIVESFAVALRSYHDVRRYADHIGARIYNSTPGSLIDAFPRKPI